MEQWYSNKDLFEKINSLQIELQDMRTELRETRESIKKYNGLREQLGNLELKIASMETKESARRAVSKAIREWGGWIVAILALLVNIMKL